MLRLLALVAPCMGEIVLSNEWRQKHCVGEMQTKALVVATATDSANLLPILAVINSTLTHSRDNDVSHVVITKHVRRLHAAVAQFVPRARVTICGGFSDLLTQRPPLDKLQRLADTQRIRRKELLSPFNFAAFYLPYVLREASRVLYLDTDAVVEADVTMLRTLDMGGAPAAAVEDCTQKVHKYVNYELLKEKDHHKLGDEKHWSRFGLSDAAYSNDTCVFNRGVVLFDSARWRELRLTETIEDLVDAFVATRAKLWRGGISQPPFLLTLAGRYLKLGVEWNVRGLGRLELGRAEWLLLAEGAKKRFNTPDLDAHTAPAGPFRHTFNPYVSPYAAHAKILHYNGDVKPWMLSKEDSNDWRRLGLNIHTTADSARQIRGACRLAACPTAVNVSTGRRLRSKCETWTAPTDVVGRVRYDQQRRSLSGERWTAKTLKTFGAYYGHACVARAPLCTCRALLSDDCVTSCASLWHRYVSAELSRSFASSTIPWANDSLASTPHVRRLQGASWWL